MKKVGVVLLGVFLLGMFSGAASASAKEIHLTMLAMADLATAEGQTFQEVVDAFHASHVDIKLDIEVLPHEAFHNKLQAMAVAKQLPDIVFLWPGKRTGHVTGAGLMKDLRPWLEGKEDQFLDWAMMPQGPNGEIWELPAHITTTHVVFSNDKLLKDLGLSYPATLDEMVAQNQKIFDAGLVSISMQNKPGWPMQSCLMSTLTERAGGMQWFEKAIVGDGASFADPEFVNALNVLKTLTDQKVFIPGMNQMDRAPALEEFIQERAVYFIEGGWVVQELQKSLTDEQKAYVSLHPFPEIPNQKGNANSHSAVPGTGFGMNANLDSEKADAAFEWIWFWAGPEGGKIRRKLGVVPSYKLPPAEDLDPLMKKLVEYIANYPMSYVIDNKMDAEGMMNVLNPGLQELTMGAITPEELAKRYEAWVAANDSNRQK